MTIGSEIPYRRSQRARDTGSLVFDHERKAAREDAGAAQPQAPRQDAGEPPRQPG